jgi:parallel beta-helix repeat protein
LEWRWCYCLLESQARLRLQFVPAAVHTSSIQTAINASSPGDTISVQSGTYNENVNVTKQLVLRGVDTGGGKPVVDGGGKDKVITLSAGGSTLDGFNARNDDPHVGAAIYVPSDNNIIKNNDASNSNNGIRLDDSSSNTLNGNTASNNGFGIFLYNSSNNS